MYAVSNKRGRQCLGKTICGYFSPGIIQLMIRQVNALCCPGLERWQITGARDSSSLPSALLK